MRLYNRYLVFDLLRTFGASLFVLTLLINLFLMGVLAVRHGLGPAQFARLSPYIMPQALVMTIPATLLFSACTLYGRLSSDNEIVALKSAGVSPAAILTPVFVIAAFLSLTCVWLNDSAVSWGRIGVKRVILESFEDIAYRLLRTENAYRTDRFWIVVQGVQDKTLIMPELNMVGDDGEVAKVTADTAEISADAAAGVISITLSNIHLRIGPVDYYTTSKEQETIVFDLEEGARKTSSRLRPSEMPLSAIPVELAAARKQLDATERRIAVETAFEMLRGDFEAFAGPAWDRTQWSLNNLRRQIALMRTEPPRRWANGFSCLFFVMIGTPVAVRLKNSEYLTSFFVVFLPILLCYYPLLAFGVDQSKSGALPPSAVWLANLATAAAGAWQLRKVMRY